MRYGESHSVQQWEPYTYHLLINAIKICDNAAEWHPRRAWRMYGLQLQFKIESVFTPAAWLWT